MDSFGLYEELFKFSLDLADRGFRIIAVGDSEKFIDGQIEKVTEPSDSYLLRAYGTGKPIETSLNGYKALRIGDKVYIPNKAAKA